MRTCLVTMTVTLVACRAPVSTKNEAAPVAPVAAAIAATDAGLPGPVFSLRRGACFGECPIYSVHVFADGAVRYSGERYVRVVGEQNARVPAASVAALAERFERAEFFTKAWGVRCPTVVTDQASVHVAFESKGVRRGVDDPHGHRCSPILDELRALETGIDELAESSRWTLCDGGWCPH